MSAAMKQNGNLIDSWRVEGRECGGESKGQESFPFSACVMISFPKQSVDDHGQHGLCCLSVGIVNVTVEVRGNVWYFESESRLQNW